VSLAASSSARSNWNEANATTKPFFGERPIQGFFNTIRPFEAVAMRSLVAAAESELLFTGAIIRTRAGIWLMVESGFPDRQVSDNLDMSE
jgi:hypothetical protein